MGEGCCQGMRDARWAKHLCCLYRTPEELRHSLRSLVEQGLNAGERCVLLGTDSAFDDATLDLAELAGRQRIASMASRLTNLPAATSYVAHGRLDADRLLAALEGLRGEAAAGQPKLRVLSEMGWAASSIKKLPEIIGYERQLDQLSARQPQITLCLYDLSQFPSDFIADVLRVHGAAVVQGALYPNPHYSRCAGTIAEPGWAVGAPSLCSSGTLLAVAEKVDEILATLAGAATATLGADFAAVILPAEAGGDSWRLYGLCEGRRLGEASGQEIIGSLCWCLGNMRRRGGPVYCTAPGCDAPELVGAVARYGVTALLVAPLVTPEGACGLVAVGRRDTTCYREHEQFALLNLANQAAVALSQVRQRYRMERQLAQRASYLVAIHEVSMATVSSLELQAVLDAISRKTAELMGTGMSSISLIDDRGENGYLASLFGLEDNWKGFTFPMQEAALAEIIRSRRPLEIRHASSDKRFVALQKFVRAVGVETYLGVPLLISDNVIGVLVIYSRRNRHFTEEEVQLLSTISSQAAVVIEKAKLYDREQQNVAKLQELNQLLMSQHSELKRAGQIHDHFTRVVLAGGGLDAITRALARLVGNPVAVEDRFYRLVSHSASRETLPALTGRPFPPEEEPRDVFGHAKIDQQIRKAALEGRAFLVSASSDADVAFPSIIAGIMVGDEFYGHVTVFERERKFEELDFTAAERAAVAFALQIMKQEAAFEVEQRLKGDFMMDLLARNYEDERSVVDRGRYLGCDLLALNRIVIVDIDGFGALASQRPDNERQNIALKDKLFAVVNEAVASRCPGSLLARQSDSIVVALCASRGGDDPRGRVARLAEEIRDQVVRWLPDITVSIGIGSACGSLHDLAKSYKEARRTLDVVKKLGWRNQVVSLNQLGVYRVLFPVSESEKELQAFATETLAPLANYDAKHHTALVRTLRSYLDHNGHLQRTAAALYVHVNTLRYRLEKIRELLPADLDAAETRLNLQLALKILQVAEGAAPIEAQPS